MGELRKSILQQAIFGNLSKYIKGDTLIDDYINIVKSNEYIKQKNVTSKLEYFYNIPENWKWVKLGEIVGIYGGKRIPAGRKLTIENTGYKYIRVADMNDITVVTDNILYVPKDIYPLIKNYTISKDDLYITVAGTIGKVGFIPKELDGANLTENANKLVFKSINKKWLFYSLTSPFVQHQIEEFTTKVGQPKLAIKRIENIEIPLPPIEEQQRIVDKIDEIFAKLDELKPIEEELNQLKKNFPISFKYAILNDAIKGKLIKNNPKLLNKVKNCIENPPFKVFDNWSWVKIGDVLDIQTGLSYKKADQCVFEDSDVRVLRGGNININFQYELKENDIYVRNVKKYEKLTKGDILTPAVTSMEQMGKVAYIDKTLDKITAGGFVYIIRSKNPEILNPKYVLYFISSKFHKEMCKPNIHKSGQAFYNLNKSGLIEQPIPIPPIEEQQRIVDKLEQLLPLCNDIEKIIGES